MEELGNVSDAELRRRLVEFGLPTMPVTATTRGPMLKKLRRLLQQAPAARDLARYSSAEEEEPQPHPTAAAMPPPAAPRRSAARSPPAAAPAPKQRPARRRAARDAYDTGSDSEVDGAPPLDTLNTLSTSDSLNVIRSRLGLAHSRPEPYAFPSYPGSSASPAPAASSAPLDLPEATYLSDFTRKLTALKAEHREKLRRGDSNGADSYPTKSYASAYGRRADASPDFRKAGEKNAFKNNLVSLSIVGGGVVFFLVLSFAYVGMKSDVPFDPEDSRNVFPICPSNSNSRRPTVECILRSEVSSAVDFLKIIHAELSKRALDARCKVGDVPAHMTDLEIRKFIGETYSDRDRERDLHNAQVLIANNPKWGMSIVQLAEPNSHRLDTALTSMDYVLSMRNKDRTGLVVSNPSVPLTCLLYDGLSRFAWAIFAMLALAVVGYLGRRAVNVYLARRKRRRDEIYSLVEQIVDFLSQESEDDPERPGRPVPIEHARDILVAPAARAATAATWDAAIEFIKRNESRVRFETDSIDGEEYRSMRWVSSRGSPKPARGGARAWQGQAFETQEGSVNNLPFSPTQCLKIRHMVDKNDKNPNLKTQIEDAILEKCGPQCKILHIEIDKVSCCVFVKCATPADAGTVYQNLHGWWYEGNLITVKYLRLERYMDHFPSSSSVGPYLKPSNSRASSGGASIR